MLSIRNKIIKLLGGYTKKEYNLLETKYQDIIDNKIDNKAICNDHIFMLLKDLYLYAKSIYGSLYWQKYMFNVIKNNMFMMLIKSKSNNTSTYYKLDTTLDINKDFGDAVNNTVLYDETEEILENILETD